MMFSSQSKHPAYGYAERREAMPDSSAVASERVVVAADLRLEVASMDIAQLISLFGALGIGSILGQYLGTAPERRSTRAAVLKALASVESARWADGQEADPSFVECARDLESAALIARLPRRAIAQYLALAYAAFWLSRENYEQDPGHEYSGGINAQFADVVRASAALVTALAWKPLSTSLRLSAKTAEIDSRANEVAHDDVERHLTLARERVAKH